MVLGKSSSRPPHQNFRGARITALHVAPDLSTLPWRLLHPTFQHFHEAHFGIPMAGAVLNTINVRLNASAIAFLLVHSSAVAVIVDQEFFPVAEESLKIWSEKSRSFNPPIVVVIAPPPSVIAAMSEGGFRVTHTYYDPSTICAWKPEWESLPVEEQGVRYIALEGLEV
ncbi:hypothetical protein JHK87_042183 [Glycine soja]|nr:hypothetical protein JHK87_042183 [Glycine soja]